MTPIHTVVDTVCLSVGWGGPATYGSDKKKLRVAKVPLYSGEKCKSAVGEFLVSDIEL